MMVTITQAGRGRDLLAAPVRPGGMRDRAGQREDRHDHGQQHASGSGRSARQDSMHDS
jgi:hypothetical protein